MPNETNGATPAPGEREAMFWQRPLDEARISDITTHPPLPSHRSLDEATTDLIMELSVHHSDASAAASPYQGWFLRWFYQTRAVAAQRELEDVVAEVGAATRNYASLLHHVESLSTSTRMAAARVANGESISTVPVGTAPTEMPRLTATEPADDTTAPATLDALLVRARHDFTEAAASAGFYVDTTAPHPEDIPPSAKARLYNTGYISPGRVEAALANTAPTMPEIAGLHGMRYPKSEWEGDDAETSGGMRGFLARASSALMGLSPLVLGLMVALCLGSVSGLLDIEDIARRPDIVKIFKLLLAVFLGGTVVTVLGKATEATIRVLFDHLNTYREPQAQPKVVMSNGVATTVPPPSPSAPDIRHRAPSPRRRKLVVALCVGGLMAFGLAETAAEGTGLQVLNQTRVSNLSQAQQRVYNQHPIAVPMFYLVGLLFSGAYLFYKGSDGWRRSELETLRPWLERKRQDWMDERRQEPHVQQVFKLAYLIEQMEAKRDELSQRLDNARASAVSEAQILHAMVEWIVASREEMPLPTLHLIQSFSNAKPMANGAPNGGYSNGTNGSGANGNGSNGNNARTTGARTNGPNLAKGAPTGTPNGTPTAQYPNPDDVFAPFDAPDGRDGRQTR